MKAKKLVIAMFALTLVAISAITATIVYCATTLNGRGKTTVTYTADGSIKGSVKATYKVGESTETNWGTVTFTGLEAENYSSTMDEANATLTKTNNYIVYKFEFVADTTTMASQNGYKAQLSLSADETNNNVKVQVSEDGTGYTDVVDLTTTIKSVDVTTDTKTVYVKVSVEDLLNNARFSGEFMWTLAKL